MSAESMEFSLNLDADNFTSKMGEAQEALESFTNVAPKVGALVETVEEMGIILAPLIISILALGAAVGAVFEAEKINQVNAAFDNLATSAGQIPEVLKNGMIEAAHGMVTETEAIEATNKALVELQTGFEKLPEVMELARKVSAVMGGSMIERFEQINQAIATGQTRGLRSPGIIIDQKKAYSEFAASIGITVDELTKAGQQQAMMNAVLETGKSKFGGVNADLKENTNMWAQVKVSLKEFTEGFAIMIDSLMGSRVQNAFQNLKNIFHSIGTSLKAEFGEGSDQAKAKLEGLRGTLASINKDLMDHQKAKAKGGIFFSEEVWQAEVNRLNALRTEYKAQIAEISGPQKLAEQSLKNQEATKEAMAKNDKARFVDAQKAAQNESKYKEDMAKLDEQLLLKEEGEAKTVQQIRVALAKEMVVEAEKTNAQEEQLRAKAAKGEELTQKQADDEIVKMEQLKSQKILAIQAKQTALQDAAAQKYLQESSSVDEGIERSFASMSQKNKNSMTDFAAMGEKTTATFSKSAVSSIQGVATGSKSATDALSSMFGQMVGGMATNYGEMLLLSSVWPPNPVGLAAGAGLIALGSILGGIGSGASTTAASASTGGGGGGSTSSSSSLAGPAAQTTPPKTTNLVFNGPVMSDATTQRWLTDQIRAASDSTAFTIQAPGGGFGA